MFFNFWRISAYFRRSCFCSADYLNVSQKRFFAVGLIQGLLNIFDNRCWLFQTNVHANVRW
ncbi:hypothetical protein D2A63_02175 [Enterococcus faecalis]|nr:hypothetical protein [Enterococcus faecalis]